MRYKRAHGIGLLEVLVASTMVIFIMVAAYAVLEVMRRSEMVTSARLEPRQNVRSVLNRIGRSVRSSSFIFTGTTVTLDGIVFDLPDVYDPDNPDPTDEGNCLVTAVPEDLTRPVDINDYNDILKTAVPHFPIGSAGAIPDGLPDGTYTVVAVTHVNRAQADHKNPNAQDVIFLTWEGVVPASHLAPSSINLAALGDPDVEHRFDCYLKPNGFRVQVLTDGSAVVGPSSVAKQVSVAAVFERKPIDGATQSELFQGRFSTRNVF